MRNDLLPSYYGGQWLSYAACAFAVAMLCICGGCARPLRSCAASIIVFGPTMLSFECPPPGFRQQDEGADTTEQPTR